MNTQLHIKILALSGVILLASCDKQKEAIEKFNIPPEIGFNNGYDRSVGTTIVDSLKLKQNGQLTQIGQAAQNIRNTRSIVLKYNNKNGNITSIRFASSSKNATLAYQGRIMTDILPIDKDRLDLTFENNSEELTTLEFTITDKLNANSKATYKIFSFANLAPIGALECQPSKTTDKLEYEFDASKSFDEDRNQGGKVDWYIFHVDGHEVRSRSSKIYYVFNKSGIYPVDLTVIDNQGKTSRVVSKSITINPDNQ